MAGTRAKGARKDASRWVLEATVVMQQSADKGQTAHGSDLHLPAVMYGAKCGTRRRRSKTRCQRSKKAPQHSSPASPRLLFDVLYGDTLPPGVSLMLPNCVGSRCQNMEAGRWPKEALRFSFEGSRGVGRPKVGTDWCGNVKPH
jgi:hypothetical protein